MNLIQEINELDYAFELSDDHDLYVKESYKKDRIDYELSKLSESEIEKIVSQLNIVGTHNWKRYFNSQKELA